jgi:hypothetical protein
MDGRVDRIRCEDGEERCDVCQKDDEAMAEAEALKRAYEESNEQGIDKESMHKQGIYEESRHEQEQEEYTHDQMLDSGINMTSSFKMQGSTPSIELLDSGFVPQSPGFTAADEYEFQSQQAKQEQQHQRIQRQNQQEGQEVWELEQQLEEWSGQCPLCFIKRHNSRHSIEDCIQNESDEIRKGWKEMKRLMKDKHWFALFSCCFDCHVPQAICQKWVQKKEQGRWEWLSGVSCQLMVS